MTMDFEERDRRYALVRENMLSQGLDALVVVGDSQINHKGFVRYLTNYRSILYNWQSSFPLRGKLVFWFPVHFKTTGVNSRPGFPTWTKPHI